MTLAAFAGTQKRPHASIIGLRFSRAPATAKTHDELRGTVKKNRKAVIDLGPLESIADCEEALRRIARACSAGEGNADDLVKAAEVIENMLRFKFLMEEQRLQGHSLTIP